MQNNEEKKTEDATSTPDQFVGRDLLESYMYYRNYISSNPYEAYGIKKKCIEFGKELLPSFIDSDEKDEDQIKKNKEEEEKTKKLYAAACKVLTTEIPGKRKITYKYLDEKNRVYEITATDGDADECQAVKEELEIVKNDFINQQHEQHMGALEDVDNTIFHVLAKTGITVAINPTFDNMRNEIKKDFLSDIMEKEKDEL